MLHQQRVFKKVILNSQAGGGKQGEKQKGVVGHCFGSEVSVWLAEIITRKKSWRAEEVQN